MAHLAYLLLRIHSGHLPVVSAEVGRATLKMAAAEEEVHSRPHDTRQQRQTGNEGDKKLLDELNVPI